MKKKQITYALLASLLLASLAGCGDNETTPKETKSESGDTTTEVVTEALSPSGLPQDLTFGGQELRFNLCNGDLYTLKEAGEVVNDAKYRRKIEIEELLDMKVVDIENGMDIWSSSDMLRTAVMSGSDDFDIISAQQWVLAEEVINHLFHDLTESEYIDFDKPWWYKDYLSEMTIGNDGAIYFAAGDVSMSTIQWMSCMYVNKLMFGNLYDSIGVLTDEVLAGKWTFERMQAYARDAYVDLSGDGRKNKNDQFGITLFTKALVDHLTYDAGVRVTERDENGIPYLVMNNERTVSFTEELYKLFYENPGAFCYEASEKTMWETMPNKFAAGEMLILPGWFMTAEYLRNADLDFTIIPYPKFDESQESYLSLVHNSAHLATVVSTSQRLDLAAAFLQEAGYRGYQELLPAYYETALKIKYTHDSSQTQDKIIDLIHDNATTDFGYIYNDYIEGLGEIERVLMALRNKNFASAYAEKEKAAEKGLEEIIEHFLDEQ